MTCSLSALSLRLRDSQRFLLIHCNTRSQLQLGTGEIRRPEQHQWVGLVVSYPLLCFFGPPLFSFIHQRCGHFFNFFSIFFLVLFRFCSLLASPSVSVIPLSAFR